MNNNTKPDPKHNARKEAAQIIAQWQAHGIFLDRLINRDVKDRAFIVETTYGIIRHKAELDWIIRTLSRTPPDDAILPYLLVGLYQVFMMDNVEDYALVNETVDAVKSSGMKGLAGFVNGVLRTALRQKDSILSRLERQQPATKYSHPELLIRRWTAQHGTEKAIELCQWNNSRPSVTMRVRHSKISVDEMLAQLAEMNVEASKNKLMPDDCIDLGHGTKVTDLPGFAEGYFMIQDASTLAPVKLLDPQPGESILDACAAPGGKTIHLCDCIEGQGQVIAMDVSQRRLAAVDANIERTGVTNVRTVQGDAANSSSLPNEKFDAVLIDAPCTNTGVLRRRPEGKWRFSKGSLQSAATVQRSLLDACSSVVKPGGRIVYSTCSLEPEEGETVVERWLNSNTDFTLSDSKYLVPPGIGSDGGYSALLTRKLDEEQ